LTRFSFRGIVALSLLENNDPVSGMKVVYKIWLDQNGKAFGDGPFELLKRVERTDSLLRAAKEMGMSYSKAWRLTRTLEERLGFQLLQRKTGGISGGGSWITPKAKQLMRHYEQFRKEVKLFMERSYQKHFGRNFF
jgi:molybdate transport system regulatory protein